MGLREINYQIGSYLEKATRRALRFYGFKVEEHRVNAKGLDVEAYNPALDLTVLIECLNWSKNSYINHYRLKSIVGNLSDIKFPMNSTKILLSSFDPRTKRQKEIFSSEEWKKHFAANEELKSYNGVKDFQDKLKKIDKLKASGKRKVDFVTNNFLTIALMRNFTAHF